MNAEIWLPLVTLVLGWAGAQITEARRDRRTSDRELQAHAREREIRRADQQRTTLLDLQDALLELSNQTSEVRAWRIPEKLWEGMTEDARANARQREREARERARATRAKVQLLTSRVLDADARQAVVTFTSTSQLAAPARIFPTTVDMKEVSGLYVDAIDRLGKLLRERY